MRPQKCFITCSAVVVWSGLFLNSRFSERLQAGSPLILRRSSMRESLLPGTLTKTS